VYLQSAVNNQKIGNGFPQTSQSHKTLAVSIMKNVEKDELVEKFKIKKESLTEENILKDFQEDIKNLPNEYRS
jgi:hypothetical protein